MFWNRKKENISKQSTKQVVKNQQQKIKKKIPLAFLKRLIPISNLSDSDLQQLQITASHYQAGDVIFNRCEFSDSLIYLVKGQCFLETSNGSGLVIDAATFNACYPLSSDTQYQVTAIAKTDVSIIHLSTTVLQQSNSNSHNPLINHKDIPKQLQQNNFFNQFCYHYQQGKLSIPPLPNVALKLRTAMQKDIGAQEAVSIVNMDAVISAKLIQIVNSPIYRPATPITTCHDAITRLGLTTTRNLVTSISMQNLFKSSNIKLNKRFLKLWQQSIHISCISQTLATLMNITNPDEALLAGLVHNIGALPVIIFANDLESSDYTEEDLDQTIAAIQGILGNSVLKQWGFPTALKHIPEESENWFFCSKNKKELTLSDIVILAKYHSLMGSKQQNKLPPIHTLPAFQKLGDNALTADMSLQTLHDAKQQITDAMNLF